MSGIPLSEQIECVKRELQRREIVYPRIVGDGAMPAAKAQTELAEMRAVLATLQALQRFYANGNKKTT